MLHVFSSPQSNIYVRVLRILVRGMEFLDLGYAPDDRDVVVTFRVVPVEGRRLEEVAEALAAESSIGTWTDVKTMLPEIYEKLRPHIFEIDKDTGIVKIAYPADLFEPENMAGVLAAIAGNIFGMKAVRYLRLEDVEFPECLVKKYPGPSFGIPGVRRILNVYDRPLLGTIIKPKVGLPTEHHVRVAYEAWIGGVDIVKDDENLTNQSFNPFEDRVSKTLEARDRAEEETGEKKIYMPNVTAPYPEMVRRAEIVKDQGGEYIMVDVVIAGFSAVQALRREFPNLVIHAHRAMHGALTRPEFHGIKMSVLALVYRMLGVDQLHVGTAVGKMAEGREEVLSNVHSLTRELYGLKPTFPVASGGIHPGHVPALLEIFGKDVIIQAGGGIHGHPDGTRAGATAMRQAIDAALHGVPLREYAKDHKELKKALEKWD